MIRLFDTHKVRKSKELSGRLWNFVPLNEEKKGEKNKVMVPGCVENLPGLGNYRGRMLYETEFEASGNIRLEFKGVSHFAEIYVDDVKRAEHYGSYTPFDFCIRNLEQGIHSLKVLADNEFRDEYALDMPNDYMSYGGISRGVLLENVPEIYIKYVHVTPLYPENNGWTADVEIVCENLSESELSANIILKIAETEKALGTRELKPGENHFNIEKMKIADVQTWTMENPVLYMAEAKVEMGQEIIDDWIDRVGFRVIGVDGRNIILNGRPVRIKGFCRHEDHPHYGCALPEQAIAYDLQLIKDMGANSVRTVHYPNDEILLDMCDEMGILVWEENHARGMQEEKMMNPYFEPQCEQVIREMIGSHYNHPSVYIWGILNECASDSEYGRKCYQAQYELIRSLDRSRPVTSASCKFKTDICQDLPDVCSWNIYPYWYEQKTAKQMTEELIQWIGTKGRGGGKPFLVSEVGAGAVYGFRDMAHDVWSEEYQAETLEKQLTEIFECKECTGLYIWQFCDVRVSRIDWALQRPKCRNNKGIVDEYRRPKMAYYVVKEIFSGLSDYQD